MSYSLQMISMHEKLLNMDPEYRMEIDFLTNEIPAETSRLSESDRWLSALAVLMGVSAKKEFRHVLKGALDDGFDPVKIRECIYQATDYLGLGRVYPFLKMMAKQVLKRGLDLGSQSTTTPENRLEIGNDKQVELFGEGMREVWKKCPEERIVINRFLTDNNFGDFYTRKGLDNRERELMTFCYIYAQGGPDDSLTSHIKANIDAGNSKVYLYAVLNANVAWVGYPRTLHAMSLIDKTA